MKFISTFLGVFLFSSLALSQALSSSASIELSAKAFIGKLYTYDEFVYEAEEASFLNMDLKKLGEDQALCANPEIRKHSLIFLKDLKSYYGDMNLSGLQLLGIEISNASGEFSKKVNCDLWVEDIIK
ncbi:MAG: hypothetical protein VX642_10575 [Bdellovibrionota bacterium]|nr:hypothetical protein [Bdellovibrionota bacterium]